MAIAPASGDAEINKHCSLTRRSSEPSEKDERPKNNYDSA